MLCPQCESRKLWRIDTVEVPTSSNMSQHQPLGVVMHGSFFGPRPVGKFEAVICAKCGFTEWYAVGLEELQPDPTHGVHFIDNEPKAGLR